MVSRQLTLGFRISETCTLNNFVCATEKNLPGDEDQNRIPVAAIEQILCGSDIRGPDALLTLWGLAGTGKSHLLMAACNQADHIPLSAGYFPLGQFVGQTPDLLKNLDQLDLVCIDDIHLIVGHRGWEEALFEQVNRILESGTRLITASAVPLRELGFLLADLASRLAWGTSVQLESLPDRDKFRLLIQRCAELGMQLSEEGAGYLLHHYSRDINALMVLVQLLDQESLIAQRRLTIPFIKEVIGNSKAG